MFLCFTLQVYGAQLMVALATLRSLEIAVVGKAFDAIGNYSPSWSYSQLTWQSLFQLDHSR